MKIKCEECPISAENVKNILEPNGTEVSTAAGGARRYRKPLKAFRWCDIKALLSDSFDEWSKHKAPRLGASLAFYTLLSLIPLLLVVVAILGLVFGHKAAEEQIIQQVKMFVGTQGPRQFKPRFRAHATPPTASSRRRLVS